jgi:protein FRA10AC1
MASYISSKSLATSSATEFEILKASHKFLRDDGEQATSWNDQLAAKYYSSLFREFAVCDLKHYKSGNVRYTIMHEIRAANLPLKFALRWRTESEVLSGAGETTCGNTRCEHHASPPSPKQREHAPSVRLTSLELPFVYEEHGETKSALVKAVLCQRCLKKLMWKREKEKGGLVETGGRNSRTRTTEAAAQMGSDERQDRGEGSTRRGSYSVGRVDGELGRRSHQRRSSRSRSPRRTDAEELHKPQRRSP